MVNVVFTGPAADAAGAPILRADLKAAAEKSGFRVLSSVSRKAQMLVASRVDTVKARKAEEMGLLVMDYPTFVEAYLDGVEPGAGQPCPYVDAPKKVQKEEVDWDKQL